MKLNNRGWSLSLMVTIICFFLFVILLITILSINYGIEKDSPNPIYETEQTDSNDQI